MVVFSDAVVATAAAHGQEDVLQTLDNYNHIKTWKEDWLAISSFYNAAESGDAETTKIFRLEIWIQI